MKDEQLLEMIEKLAEDLSIKVRYERGDFVGGLCRVDEEQVLIVHRDLSPGRKVQVIARELSRLDLDDVYVVPALRKVIESESGAD
jgi:predicted transcriptional regulator